MCAERWWWCPGIILDVADGNRAGGHRTVVRLIGLRLSPFGHFHEGEGSLSRRPLRGSVGGILAEVESSVGTQQLVA